MGRRHHKLLGLTANQELFQKSFLDIHTGTRIPVPIHGHTSTCAYIHIIKHKYHLHLRTHQFSHIHLHTLLILKHPHPHPLLQPHNTPVCICSHATFTHSPPPVYQHTHTKKHIRGAHSFALAPSKGGAKALTEKSGQGHYTYPLTTFS